MLCDLHTHSTFSDGTLTPRQLVALAKEANLGALALCDHNTVKGLPEFVSAARSAGILAVPGVEFSTQWEDIELHIVALFVKPQDYGQIQARLDAVLRRKEASNRALVENLRAAGIHLDYGTIARSTPDGNVNRAILARQMVASGYCESVKDAFSRYLHPKFGFYTPPLRPGAWDTVKFIRSLGAVSVLAHPLLSMQEQQLRRFLSQGQGLDAMEVYYSTYDSHTTELAKAIAGEYHLLQSGGSDFHGENKPDIFLGVGRGNLAISTDILHSLQGIACSQAKN